MKRFIRGVFCAMLGMAVSATAQTPKEKPKPITRAKLVTGAELITPQTDQAIKKGLEFLASRQQASGAIGSGQYNESIAITSLSGLAFMAGGNMPGEGKYGPNVDKALKFVLENVGASGYIVVQHSTSHGPMYDHGFGTLFLAEMYGMTQRADIREKTKKAAQLIINTQNPQGGWRYYPRASSDADISVTICQIMALRAARNAGIDVPKNTVDNCVKYVKQCQNKDGGFSYMIGQGQSGFPRSAAGVVALYSAGIYEGPEIKKGLDYLMDWMDNPAAGRRDSHLFYGHYYAVQAMYTAGGDYWSKWFPNVRDQLLSLSRPDGSWVDSVGPEYATAMACIVLQVPNDLLTIFQR